MRKEEHNGEVHNQEHAQTEKVFGSVVRVKRNVVLIRQINAAGIAAPHRVKRHEMNNYSANDQEGEKIVQRKEPSQRVIADGVITAQPDHDLITDKRRGTEQIGYDCRAPE